MFKFNKSIKAVNRVDFQVFILTAVLVVCSCSCIFLFNYTKTYNSMIESLTRRTDAIYQYLDATIEKESFNSIQVYADKDTEIYQGTKMRLEEIKSTSDVRYLYTAKKNDQGEFVYLIDGLDNTATDFRYPGDLIESDIIPDIERAWKGESILPKKILNTDWGKIFLAYYPIHGENVHEVIGILGIEFDAENEYNTYQNLRLVTPIIIGISCLVAAWIAFKLFKRISNPRNQDLYNTDQLTQLKNRNAFDFDMKNMNNKSMKQLGIIVLDIDHLKYVNDQLGHLKGDEYIKKTAEALRSHLYKNMWAYRVGGDEFVLFMEQSTSLQQDSWKEAFLMRFKEKMIECQIDGDISIGMVIFDEKNDQSIYETFRRADKNMYLNKQSKHKKI